MNRKAGKTISLLLCMALVLSPMTVEKQVMAKKKISLNRKKATVTVGKQIKLKVKGTKKKVTWKSQKKKIATVSKKGVVKGRKVGKTNITAKVAGKKLVCKVTVKPKKKVNGSSGTSTPTPKITSTAGTKETPGQSQSDKPADKPTATPTGNPTGTSSASPTTPTEVPTPSPTPVDTSKPEPVFSKNSGSYADAFDLELYAPEGSTIYYTTDGSVPLYEDDVTNPGGKEGKAFELAEAQEEFVASGVTTEYTSGGVNISFEKQYNSICFKAPETNWTEYNSIAIEYTVNQVGNGSDSLGLQVAPIYAGAESSWNGGNGQSDTTRVKEERQSLAKGHGVAEISLTDNHDYSSVGRLMLGVYNSGTYSKPDKITIHAIHLLKAGESYEEENDIPAKLPTNTYTKAIRVKNRDYDANLLCSDENIPYMYDPTDRNNGPYYPKSMEGAVPKATIIRALAVDAEGNKSKVVTKVYFVDKDLQSVYKNASVISVITDPDNLLSKSTGIYRYGNWDNSGDEWERPAEVTYFDEDGTIPFETTMGLRVHGNYTRRWGQKSLRLYFREELGMKNLKGYQLIPGAVNADGSPTTKYKRFILRNGGNEYAYSKMQDVFIQSMVSDRAFTTQSARPCVLFLNGEYWGLYNLTERYSDNYLEEEFGVDKDNVVVIKNKELDERREEDLALYDELMSMADLDMSQQANYEKFKEMVDIQSYLDYYATEIYIGNNDWPDNNTQLWRTREDDDSEYGDTKWRYMLYDTEFSMDLWGSDSGGTKNRIAEAKSKDALFKALCENEEFCQSFADTLMDICRNNFNVTKANQKLDAMAEIYRPLMVQYKARFGNGDVDSRVNGMKSYIAGRESQLKGFIQSSLGIQVK